MWQNVRGEQLWNMSRHKLFSVCSKLLVVRVHPVRIYCPMIQMRITFTRVPGETEGWLAALRPGLRRSGNILKLGVFPIKPNKAQKRYRRLGGVRVTCVSARSVGNTPDAPVRRSMESRGPQSERGRA
jgi:hypothetical protein